VHSAICEQLGIEPEVVFTLKRALPPGRAYSRDEVIDAIGAAYPAIEIVISRFQRHESAAPLDRLADNLSNGGLVLGAPLEGWRQLDFGTLPLTLSVTPEVGEPSVLRSRGGHPQGDPLVAMSWFANARAGQGIGMQAGEIVTTGSYAGLHYAAPGAHVRVEFEGLGAVELYS
jgi:2-keto-4-pentenoate hydratase